MNTILADAALPKEEDVVDRHVAALLEEWQRNGEVNLVRFWRNRSTDQPANQDDELERLGALIKADLRCRIERGRSVEIEDYLDCFPELERGDNRIISLIYEEYCVREECGASPDAEEFYERYAPWKNSLVWQLQLHRLFNPADGQGAPTPRYPEAGDLFEEYQLLSLIGKGGSSRVFLASDLSLGGKRVVLKVSLDQGEEPKTQGVLDHPHIVPVNSVAFQPEEGLRGLSMPYRPGLPLDEVVRRVRPASQPRPARALWDVLFAGDSPFVSSLGSEQLAAFQAKGPSGAGWAGFPRTGTFAEGVAWIAMILARTLHYAHGMKTFHRDVKPGNVLLTLQHGPQLLDFNLAESPYAVQHAKSAVLGGTLPYMAPEQIEAFLDPDCWNRVGARSDIYSLGLVLRELLTGEAPDLPDERLRLPAAMRDLLNRRRRLVTDVRHLIPQIPCSLEAIVKRCLCFHPDDRYPSAEALADDLKRFLTRRPLVVAANPSRRERLANWIYRNRLWFVVNACYLSVIGFLAFQFISPYLKPVLETNPEYLRAVQFVETGSYREAVEILRKLAAEYPKNPLVLMYLGIGEAKAEGLNENPAQVSMGPALATPDSRAVILSWIRKHPSLIRQLSEFAKVQLDYVNKYLANRQPAGRGPLGEASDAHDQAVERKYIDTIDQTLELALTADPDSEVLQRQMAILEEHLGRLEPALDRLNKLIRAKQGRGAESDYPELMNCLLQRSRIILALTRHLQGTGIASDRSQALDLIRQSCKSLSQADSQVSDLASKKRRDGGDSLLVFNFYWIATETWLALGEIEKEQGLATSTEAFKNAKVFFNRLDAFLWERFPDKIPPDLESLRKRVMAGLGVK